MRIVRFSAGEDPAYGVLEEDGGVIAEIVGDPLYQGVTFTGQVKESLAYPLKGHMEDRKLRIPDDATIRADLRKVQKVTTTAGNIRFVAESTPDGHADRFWALALAIHAAMEVPGDTFAASRPRQTRTRTDLQGY